MAKKHRDKLVSSKGDYAGANLQDQDEYRAENVFWVPKEARRSHLQANAKQSRTLATLRDTLLLKLLSGGLSVAKGTQTLEARACAN